MDTWQRSFLLERVESLCYLGRTQFEAPDFQKMLTKFSHLFSSDAEKDALVIDGYCRVALKLAQQQDYEHFIRVQAQALTYINSRTRYELVDDIKQTFQAYIDYGEIACIDAIKVGGPQADETIDRKVFEIRNIGRLLPNDQETLINRILETKRMKKKVIYN